MRVARRAAARVSRAVDHVRERAAIARWTRAIPPVQTRLDLRADSFDLCIGAILQNEAPYLREWIEFHRLVGVQHFFLFDDRSDDHPDIVLRPYIEAGVVTLQPLPSRLPRFVFDRQGVAYNLCLRRYGPCTRWLAFLDLDEFLYARDEDDLVEVLADYDDAPAVAVNWIFFGTSGHILDPGGLVIEQFTRCRSVPDVACKLVVAPARTESILSSHIASFRNGARPVDGLHRECRDGYVDPPTVERLRINHYWTKSVEEWLTVKLRRGNVAALSDRPAVAHLFAVEREWNDAVDRTIQRFLPELRRRLDDSDEVLSGGV